MSYKTDEFPVAKLQREKKELEGMVNTNGRLAEAWYSELQDAKDKLKRISKVVKAEGNIYPYGECNCSNCQIYRILRWGTADYVPKVRK